MSERDRDKETKRESGRVSESEREGGRERERDATKAGHCGRGVALTAVVWNQS